MAKYVWHDGAWCRVEKRTPGPALFPSIHRDTMSVGVHPATGQATDSKSTWRRLNREHGYTEMGTDAPTEMPVRSHRPAVTKADIAESIQMLKQGYKPPPVEQVNAGDFADAGVKML